MTSVEIGAEFERKVAELLSANGFHVFQNLYVPNPFDLAQCDIVALTTKYVVTVECKSLSGTLADDGTARWAWYRNGETEPRKVTNPIKQTYYHAQVLADLLGLQVFPFVCLQDKLEYFGPMHREMFYFRNLVAGMKAVEPVNDMLPIHTVRALLVLDRLTQTVPDIGKRHLEYIARLHPDTFER